MTKNPYAKIKNNTVLTASPQELTLMLYDGAIKFGNQSKAAMLNGDVNKAHNLNIRVQDIIQEFLITLDDKYEVSESFRNVYELILRKLVEANVRKDSEIMEEALTYIRDMRNTWKEAMAIAKSQEYDKAL